MDFTPERCEGGGGGEGSDRGKGDRGCEFPVFRTLSSRVPVPLVSGSRLCMLFLS